MNIVGIISLTLVILFLHVIVKRYENLEEKNKEVFAILRQKYNIPKGKKQEPVKQMNYEKINLEKIEDDEGIDFENDFSLLKKDLLKYVDDSRDIYHNELFDDSNLVNDKDYQKQTNLYQQKKDYDFDNLDIEEIIQQPFGKTNIGSMDKQLEQVNLNINEMKNDGLQVQTFKPDMWMHKNENQMNGGKIFKDLNLTAFDHGELDYKMI